MGASRFVGRVGALAFVLGAGAVVAAAGSGVAQAAPSESGSGAGAGDTAARSSATAERGSGLKGRTGTAKAVDRKSDSATRPAPAAAQEAATSAGSASTAVPVASSRRAALKVVQPLTDPAASTAPQSPTAPALGLASLVSQAAVREQEGARQAAATGAVAVTAIQSPNLLVNPGAEFGDPSLTGYSSVTVPGWTLTGTPTVIRYGTDRRFPSALSIPGPLIPFASFPIYGNGTLTTPANSGKQFFGGGPVADSSISQTVDLVGALGKIDLGGVTYNLSASLGGFFWDFSHTNVEVNFLDQAGNSLGTSSLDTVTPWDRRLVTGFIERTSAGTIPVGTRSAVVTVSFEDRNPWLGNYNNAYADNISFTISEDLPHPGVPLPPVSTVGELDHVFLVYMENKGYTNIVGSKNAPVINEMFNTYGSANQMYALTHPSTPNYSAVVGGSDFNINYDCTENCVDARNLSNTIADAGKTWAAYEQNGGGYTNAGELGFLTFANIFNNPVLVNANIRPLTQMATDLSNPATTPNFVWWAADEDNNMEGPVDDPIGILRFAISQITNQQYNVKAGDNFLGETLPVIMSSNTWLDPNVKSAIFLTWDEDNNNLSLGFDNQGNHIVMIVIPSPGAVASGMRSGNFQVDTRYDHYSLMRTIEESLGLESLTQNDRYAVPMNEFWEPLNA